MPYKRTARGILSEKKYKQRRQRSRTVLYRLTLQVHSDNQMTVHGPLEDLALCINMLSEAQRILIKKHQERRPPPAIKALGKSP